MIKWYSISFLENHSKHTQISLYKSWCDRKVSNNTRSMPDAYQWLVIYNQYIMTSSLAGTQREDFNIWRTIYTVYAVFMTVHFFLSPSKIYQSVSKMCTAEWHTSCPSQLRILSAWKTPVHTWLQHLKFFSLPQLLFNGKHNKWSMSWQDEIQ
jgi:hypothetical protein